MTGAVGKSHRLDRLEGLNRLNQPHQPLQPFQPVSLSHYLTNPLPNLPGCSLDASLQIPEVEVFFPGGVVPYDLAVSDEPVFIGNQSFQAYGAPGVDFGGGNAHFCTEAVAEAIGKAGGYVPVDPGGID